MTPAELRAEGYVRRPDWGRLVILGILIVITVYWCWPPNDAPAWAHLIVGAYLYREVASGHMGSWFVWQEPPRQESD